MDFGKARCQNIFKPAIMGFGGKVDYLHPHYLLLTVNVSKK